MFEASTLSDTMQSGLLAGMGARQQGFDSQAMQQAMHLYWNAHLQAGLARTWARLTGRRRELASLAETTAATSICDRHYAGTRTVAIASIRGSENRTHDFDRDFLPLQEHSRGRWLSVARARLGRVALPPVELVQVGDAYYVRDGHHRISVAKALGENFIEAEVTAW